MGTILNIGNKIIASTDLWYGFAIDNGSTSPTVKRIGNMGMHRLLPLQEAMTSVLLGADGTEAYELKKDDWSKKADGTASDLSGTDGDVMIRVPNYFFRVEKKGDWDYLKFSPYDLDGFTRIINIPITHFYISAYEAGIDRTNNKLVSIINTDVKFRGGNNTSAWDAEDRTLLGRPATNISRTNFRTYARNKGAGWEMLTYGAHRAVTFLFVLEYATRNSQLAVNASLDANGFKQGGLGAGATNINSTNWNEWNSYNPFVPMGYSNSLGTGTGEVDFEMPAGYGALTTKVNRYRGIELPFGHIWKNTDGLNWKASAVDGNVPYYTDDNSLFNDNNYTGFAELSQAPSSNGYISRMESGHITPTRITGGGQGVYWADYFYQALPSSGESLRTVLFGGFANYGSFAGLGYSITYSSPSDAFANFGSRLCYFPT